MTDPLTREALAQIHGTAGDVCLRCGSPIASLGVQQFRTGGNTGAWKLVFGELAELGEGMTQFEMFACQTCRHVEFRLPAAGG